MKIVDFKKIISYFNFQVDRDWKTVLLGFALLLIIVFLLNGYIFWKYQKELSAEIKIEEAKVITVDRNTLQKVIDEIDRKERQYKKPVIMTPRSSMDRTPLF